MCGIFAYLSDNQRNHKEIPLLKENGMKCQHRGPDKTNELCIHGETSFNYFLFHRLSINGLNQKSDQPMKLHGNDNHLLLCNGEIYNYKELAKEYNIQLETDSDCEIILHLYKLSRVNEFIKKLDGVFSFLIYDKSLNQVIVGHDPFGIRPLYYSQVDKELFFSSEMKCLSELTTEIKFYPPGSFSFIDLKTFDMKTYSYYQIAYEQIKDTDETIIITTIQNKLEKAVQKRLVSDRPLGCLLSGGLDSSVITSIVCQQMGAENVHTFAIGLEGSPDLLSAQKVADYLGTHHTNVVVSEKDMLEAIDETIYQIESNDTTTIRASVPMFLLTKYIRDTTDIKVILSGEGSDEASGSYLYFHNAPNETMFQKECIRLLQDVRYFDVLRGDKTTSGSGLELRVPFFDKEFMNYYMGIPPEKKMVRDGMEKYLLRKAFVNRLPEEIVWRRKDGFSDGVSSFEKPWYETINEYTQKEHGCSEKKYYDKIFQKYFPNQTNIIPYEWLPKWTNQKNPSGRLVSK
jgi:asparagine synthase (glutamine-hydrolysing)